MKQIPTLKTRSIYVSYSWEESMLVFFMQYWVYYHLEDNEDINYFKKL